MMVVVAVVYQWNKAQAQDKGRNEGEEQPQHGPDDFRLLLVDVLTLAVLLRRLAAVIKDDYQHTPEWSD